VNILNFESYSMLWFAQKPRVLFWENVTLAPLFCHPYTPIWPYVTLGIRETERQSWWMCGGYVTTCHFCVWIFKGCMSYKVVNPLLLKLECKTLILA